MVGFRVCELVPGAVYKGMDNDIAELAVSEPLAAATPMSSPRKSFTRTFSPGDVAFQVYKISFPGIQMDEQCFKQARTEYKAAHGGIDISPSILGDAQSFKEVLVTAPRTAPFGELRNEVNQLLIKCNMGYGAWSFL